MPSERAAGAADPRRLHWSSLFFGLGPVARGAVPLLIILLASREVTWQFWVMLGLLPSGIGVVVRFLTLTYRLEERELIIAEGLLSRRSRHVPYERIQQVELRQGILQRLLGVADVKVESAGGAETPEARLTVLSLARAEDLRAQIAARRGQFPVDAAEDTTVLRLPWSEIALLGLAEGRGWLVIGAAMGVMWQVADMLDLEWPVPDWLSREGIRRGTALASAPPSVFTAIAVVLGAVVLFRVLSIGWTIFKLHGFALTREHDLLRSRFGLVTRFTAAIPRRRVQLLTIVEPPLLRLMRRASIKVETAGRVEADQAGVGAQWLAPIVGSDRVDGIVAEVLPDVTPRDLPWQPVAGGSRARLARRFLLQAVAATGLAVAFAGWWGLAILPLGVVLAASAARGLARGYAFAVTDDAVAFRSGWWTRRTSIVRIPRIQVIALDEDIFDARWAMASLRVDTAGAGGAGHAVHIPFLDRALAHRLFATLRAAAGRTDLQW